MVVSSIAEIVGSVFIIMYTVSSFKDQYVPFVAFHTNLAVPFQSVSGSYTKLAISELAIESFTFTSIPDNLSVPFAGNVNIAILSKSSLAGSKYFSSKSARAYV